MTTLHTIGHGTLASEAFATLLTNAHVGHVVDVRSFPGSRRNPHFGREEMQRWLPAAGFGYDWIRSLGGRRRPAADSRHTALRHKAFRAYADHMETPDFLAGVEALLGLAAGGSAAVMCSESLWWRCRRRLLADHLLLVAGVTVVHLMHDGRLTTHTPTEGVRLAGEVLVYDAAPTAPAVG